MTFLIETQPLPLMLETEGSIRVSGTRVTLDALVYAFLEGLTAEEITYQYPTLDLPDVYSVIGYYLHHRAKVDAYIRERKRDAHQVREENEAKFIPNGIRERLLARQGN